MLKEVTNIGGVADVLGRDREVAYSAGSMTIDSVSVDDFYQILALLRGSAADAPTGSVLRDLKELVVPRSEGAAAAAVAAQQKLSTKIEQIPAEDQPEDSAQPEAPPEKQRRPRARREQPQTPAQAATESKPKPADDLPSESLARAKRVSSGVPARSKPAEADVVSGDVAAAIEREKKASAAPAATPAPKGGKPLLDQDNLPEKILSAKSIRAVVLYFVNDLSVTDLDTIVAECERLKDEVPLFAKPGLTERIETALDMALDRD